MVQFDVILNPKDRAHEKQWDSTHSVYSLPVRIVEFREGNKTQVDLLAKGALSHSKSEGREADAKKWSQKTGKYIAMSAENFPHIDELSQFLTNTSFTEEGSPGSLRFQMAMKV